MKTPFESVRKSTLVGALAIALAGAGAANAITIDQTFSWTTGALTEGGVVTFTDLETSPDSLKITFDNTSTSGSSALITGIVFNVTQDISAATVGSFLDGNGNAISGWEVLLDVDSNITPGNTKFDITFRTTNGVNGGIYNTGVSTNIANGVPDIATLILDISAPDPWALESIGNDSILRMQRTGPTGAGSLKIITSSSTGGQTSTGGLVPEPGILSLLGVGLLGQAFLLRQRRRRQQS